MSKEQQPYSTFKATGVGPNKVTDLKLSGGQTIPYIYQLGVQSTVPYVKLIGGATSQKLFTWEEKIIVPPGAMVTVQNACYHPGDIWIVSGWDPSAIPARVTVPIRLIPDPGGKLFFVPEFPVDTRRARRAYVSGLRADPLNPITFTATGTAKLRSHPTNDALSDSGVGIPEYTNTIILPPATDPGLMPLGENALVGDDRIHALLDVATFTWDDLTLTTESGAIHYILDYK